MKEKEKMLQDDFLETCEETEGVEVIVPENNDEEETQDGIQSETNLSE